MQPPEAMVMSIIYAASEGHVWGCGSAVVRGSVDVCDLLYHRRPRFHGLCCLLKPC